MSAIIIKNARLSYPTLHQPKALKNDPTSKPRYSANLLVSKEDTATIKAIKAEVKKLVDEKFDGKPLKPSQLFYSDGDGENGDEYSAGCYIISANRAESQGRPLVIDRKTKPVQPGDIEDPEAGDYVNAKIDIYKPGQWSRIAASLEVVQYAKKGEAIGAGKPTADGFDAVPDEDLDEDDGLG